MNFASIEFLLYLWIVILAVMAIRQKRWTMIFLLAASYYFYMSWNAKFIFLIVYSSAMDYYCGLAIHRAKTLGKKRLYLAISLIGNLGLLAFFKYTNFFLQSLNPVLDQFAFGGNIPLYDIVLPVGISFYTFQTLSYTIDIYRGELEPSHSTLDFFLYIAFFPQLVAGPIVRARDFLPQLKRPLVILPENLRPGITLIALGLVKKVLVADNLAPSVDMLFGRYADYGNGAVWLGSLAFGIQAYCDFSGYSDIAIGCGKIFNFDFPINFRAPFFAPSPKEFWNRWHITLSSWLRDYLYIPLGGNRRGPLRTYFNLIIVMLLGGLWHGAQWNFIVWGLYQGILLSVHKAVFVPLRRFPRWVKCVDSKVGHVASVLLTQFFVFLGWIPFRAVDFRSIFELGKKFCFITIDSGIAPAPYASTAIPLFALFGVGHFIFYRNPQLVSRINRLPLPVWVMLLICIVLLMFIFAPSETEAFMYFQF